MVNSTLKKNIFDVTFRIKGEIFMIKPKIKAASADTLTAQGILPKKFYLNSNMHVLERQD